ncbi:hypothetical protein [Phytohabitans suffuscus]|uniref:Uncharacterized protein n=1 Tax=Phytohabitans suffuscus TaxID=624315 RepID=A0A6F8YUA0_9ACTN|nr:hypothetical protein [Phytohabitans suffuscus]BCB89411.1 hypothetical protein Psuf_067240 [Phytohabitans suffuscus]
MDLRKANGAISILYPAGTGPTVVLVTVSIYPAGGAPLYLCELRRAVSRGGGLRTRRGGGPCWPPVTSS